jgi:hypothetical protein
MPAKVTAAVDTIDIRPGDSLTIRWYRDTGAPDPYYAQTSPSATKSQFEKIVLFRPAKEDHQGLHLIVNPKARIKLHGRCQSLEKYVNRTETAGKTVKVKARV